MDGDPGQHQKLKDGLYRSPEGMESGPEGMEGDPRGTRPQMEGWGGTGGKTGQSGEGEWRHLKVQMGAQGHGELALGSRRDHTEGP